VKFIRYHPEVLFYSVLAWGLWMIPVFDRLHVESGAVVATAAFFTAGLGMLRRMRSSGGRSNTSAYPGWARDQVAYPLAAGVWLATSMLWAPNCDWLRGAGLFATFIFPSAVLGVAVAVFVQAKLRGQRWVFLAAGVAIIVVGPVYDLGFHPQFYTYNHVFGGVLGPIYDAELVIRPGVFLFRLLTLLWAGLLVALATGRKRVAGACLLLLAVGYMQAGPLGINTSRTYLENQFSGRVSGDGYALFYNRAQVSDSLLWVMTDELDWQMHRLESVLDVRPSDEVHVYAWPSPDERARLTGARHTSVAPVWLDTPQIHVIDTQFPRFVSHELVHVFSREFGLPIVHASRLAGLVEGLAVAFESPRGSAAADHLIAAASTGNPYLVQRTEQSLTASGFWTGRGSVSYTTTGSFVSWLGRTYGMERLKRVYANGEFENVYGKRVAELITEWQDYLGKLPVLARTAGEDADHSFSRLSLFEVSCPHWVEPHVQALRRAIESADHDALEDVVARWPEYGAARYVLAGSHAESLMDPSQSDRSHEHAATAIEQVLAHIPETERSALWFELSARAARFTAPERAATLARESIRRTRVDFRQQRAARGLLLEDVGGRLPSGITSEINAYKMWTETRMLHASGDHEAALAMAREARLLYAEMGDVAMVPVLHEWMQRMRWQLIAGNR